MELMNFPYVLIRHISMAFYLLHTIGLEYTLRAIEISAVSTLGLLQPGTSHGPSSP